MRLATALALVFLAPAFPQACDNTIRDTLKAQWRSPTECEIQFDLSVRKALEHAFQPAVAAMTAKGWIVEKRPKIEPLTGMDRGAEKHIARIDLGSNGNFEYDFALDPAGTAYQSFAKEMHAAMQNAAGNFAKLQQTAYRVKNATELRISATVNLNSAGLTNFRGEHTVLQIPGTAYAVSSSHVQAPTGGGEDNSEDAALAFVGPWSQPAYEKHSDGGEQLRLTAKFNPARPLRSVQSIVIKAQGTHGPDVLKLIDYAALNGLCSR